VRAPPPLDWGVEIGEIAHNLRSALDGLVYQLALPTTKAPAGNAQFPIFLGGRAADRKRFRFCFEGVRTKNGRTVTYADRWLRVRSDQCVTGAGQLVAPYHVREYASWVSAVALTRDGQVVLVHQYRQGAGAVVLELPGGAVDPTDPGPVAAARRELAEETGVAAAEWSELGRVYANPASHDNVVWSCLGLDARLAGPPARELGEDIEVECRDLIAVLRDVHGGRIVFPALHLAALHFAVRAILTSDRADLAELRARLRADLLEPP
jgi:8-oxo-dGTP pyrophosphatase MutT (NUDIX family)